MQLGSLARKAGIFTRAYEFPEMHHGSRAGFATTKQALDEVVFAQKDDAVHTSLLTSKERQCLDLLCEGLDNTEIAQSLKLHIPTVKFHASNLYGKLGINTRHEAVVIKDFADSGVAIKTLTGGPSSSRIAEDCPDPQDDDLTLYIKRVLGKKAAQAAATLDTRYGLGESNLHHTSIVWQISSQNLGFLQEIGVMTQEMMSQKRLDLPAAILGLQLNSAHAAPMIKDKRYSKLALEAAYSTAETFITGRKVTT